MTQRIRTMSILVGGMVLGAVLMLVGLARADRIVPERPAKLVALGQLLEAEHRRVDLLLERGDVAGAIAALEDVRRLEWPTRAEAGEAALVLRHDAYGRLVRLRLDHPEVAPMTHSALFDVIEEGLEESHPKVDANPFTARLVAQKGEVLELLERDDEALSAYEQAIDINQVLLERAIGGEP